MKPKVIVAITTYNLEKYINECLDSVLMQKTNFDYKIIIADDASTDKTVEILKEYQSKYPEKISLILNEKNLGSLATSNKIFDRIDCEYFSFLDGDDYWLDENRLQKQVDFLDSHPEYTLCGSNTHFLINGKIDKDVVSKKQVNKSYTFEEYVKDIAPFVHTSSLLVRNIIFKDGLPKCYIEAVDTFENCALRGEDFRRVLHHEKGLMYVSDDYYSVYRIHSQGTWQGKSEIHKILELAISSNFYKKYFGDKYGDLFEKKARFTYKLLMKKLIMNGNFLNSYSLPEKDDYLLRCYLADVRNDEKMTKKNGLVNFLVKGLFKLY